jgi:spore coat protein H
VLVVRENVSAGWVLTVALVLPACGGDSVNAFGVLGGGGTGGAPDVGGAAGAAGAGATLPAAEVFAPDQIIDVQVTMSPTDRSQMEEHGDDELYLPAEVRISAPSLGDVDLGQVGVRHKGAWSLHHCWDDFGGVRSHDAECAKISYKLSFDEYAPDTRLAGLKHLNLHAASGDATKLRELLAYRMFNDFGVIAPRTSYARITINGDLLGLFVVVEEIDGRFADFHYPASGDGNLYKEVWPRAGLPDDPFVAALETNRVAPDVSDIQAFAAAVGATGEATFAADMAPWVDRDALLRYVAVDRAEKNWDGIMAFYAPETPHNFYWYDDGAAEARFHLIPWDLDNTFWEFDPFTDPQQWVTSEPVPDWNVMPASCDPIPVWDPANETHVTPPGCDPLLRLLAVTGWDRFVTIGQELLAGPLRYEVLDAEVTRASALIEPVIATDPTLDVGQWQVDRETFRGTLQRAITDYAAFLGEGYRIQEPPVVLPEPTQAELDAPMAESGLVTDRVNNFEFTGGAAGPAPLGVFAYAGEGVTFTPTWNQTAPLSGGADLRFDFLFTRVPGTWNEWVDVALCTPGEAEVDVSGFTQISITMRADRDRTVRVRVRSPAYLDSFNGAWTEFGNQFAVSTTGATVKLVFSRMFYPDWAKAAWTVGQGWTTSDADARLVLLRRFTGLAFAPAATTDASGELLDAQESGFLQIDNVYFQ